MFEITSRQGLETLLKNGVLTGVRMLDLSRLLPGPFCSMILADHGAEVIAIEDRRFQADGLFLTPVNRNKTSGRFCKALNIPIGRSILGRKKG